MAQEEQFDSFYRDTRDATHLQAFLLTGDLTAATAAVKDAYTIAWHHWRKVTQRGNPIDYVRPLAWRLAQRRHTGRIWHRNKGLSPEHITVLDAVHQLGTTERRLLLLVDVAHVELGDAAREVAVTFDVARAALRDARTQLSQSLGTPVELLGATLQTLGGPASAVKLPRPSIVLRAGRERRRLYTVGAVVGGLALTIGMGAAAREPGQERSSAVHQVLPGGKPVGEKLPAGVRLTMPSQLLQPLDLQSATRGTAQTWTVTRTDNNTHGDGINTICQQTRYADPRGLAALVRVFEAAGKPVRDAVQSVEISPTTAAAQKAFDTTVGWFAGCQEARLQLMASYAVAGVGDQATILQMQRWADPTATYSVGFARVDHVTTMTVLRTVGGVPPKAGQVAALLATAVSRLCPTTRPDCTGVARATAAPPPPSGDEPGFLSVVDLPPVSNAQRPWTAVASTAALRSNPAATRCDAANFGKGGAVTARWRSFLIADPAMPKTFGLDETYGSFKSGRGAATFFDAVRHRLATCENRDLTASVGAEHRVHLAAQHLDVSVWHFRLKISTHLSVSFRVAFVRNGSRVAQLTFIPSATQDTGASRFEQLVVRAGERLGELR